MKGYDSAKRKVGGDACTFVLAQDGDPVTPMENGKNQISSTAASRF
jgi:hypothetical protein